MCLLIFSVCASKVKNSQSQKSWLRQSRYPERIGVREIFYFFCNYFPFLLLASFSQSSKASGKEGFIRMGGPERLGLNGSRFNIDFFAYSILLGIFLCCSWAGNGEGKAHKAACESTATALKQIITFWASSVLLSACDWTGSSTFRSIRRICLKQLGWNLA